MVLMRMKGAKFDFSKVAALSGTAQVGTMHGLSYCSSGSI